MTYYLRKNALRIEAAGLTASRRIFYNVRRTLFGEHENFAGTRILRHKEYLLSTYNLRSTCADFAKDAYNAKNEKRYLHKRSALQYFHSITTLRGSTDDATQIGVVWRGRN